MYIKILSDILYYTISLLISMIQMYVVCISLSLRLTWWGRWTERERSISLCMWAHGSFFHVYDIKKSYYSYFAHCVARSLISQFQGVDCCWMAVFFSKITFGFCLHNRTSSFHARAHTDMASWHFGKQIWSHFRVPVPPGLGRWEWSPRLRGRGSQYLWNGKHVETCFFTSDVS
jgi:hypothetical protein